MGDIRVEVALSIRAGQSEGPLWDAATARLWRPVRMRIRPDLRCEGGYRGRAPK